MHFLQFVYLFSLFQKEDIRNRPYDVVIVDEVDNIFLDQSSSPAILSQNFKIAEYKGIFKKVYELVSKNSNISNKEIRNKIVNSFPRYPDPKDLAVSILKNAVNSANDYKKDVDYVVLNGQVTIIDNTTGMAKPGSKWSNYIHEMVEIKEGLELKDPNIPYCLITQDTFFTMYSRISGVTGTIGTTEDITILKNMYQVDTFSIPTNKPSKRIVEQKFLNTNSLLSEIEEKKSKGRPVLVIFDDIFTLNESKNFLKPDQEIKGIDPKSDATATEKAGNKGVVTFATIAAGRGTDIKPTKKAYEKGGLHVIINSIPKNKRTLNQIIGRAARQGNPGSVMISSEACGIFLPEIIPKVMYQNLFTLQKKFAEILKKQYSWMLDQKYSENLDILFPIMANSTEVMELFAWATIRKIYDIEKYGSEQLANLRGFTNQDIIEAIPKMVEDLSSFLNDAVKKVFEVSAQHNLDCMQRASSHIASENVSLTIPWHTSIKQKEIENLTLKDQHKNIFTSIIYQMTISSWGKFFQDLERIVDGVADADNIDSCNILFDEFMKTLSEYVPPNQDPNSVYKNILRKTIGTGKNPPVFLDYKDSFGESGFEWFSENLFRRVGKVFECKTLVNVLDNPFERIIGALSGDFVGEPCNLFLSKQDDCKLTYGSSLAPTYKEAAAMAGHIYGAIPEHICDNIKGKTSGWCLIDIYTGSFSMKIGVYS